MHSRVLIVAFINIERLFAEMTDIALSGLCADSFDKPRAQIIFERCRGGWFSLDRFGRLKLTPLLRVNCPGPAKLHGRIGKHFRLMDNYRFLRIHSSSGSTQQYLPWYAHGISPEEQEIYICFGGHLWIAVTI